MAADHLPVADPAIPVNPQARFWRPTMPRLTLAS
jgi:hypothetical protein